MAEGIFSAMVRRDGNMQRIQAGSAGTVCYQRGSRPDSRALAVAARNGVDISSVRARCIDALDLSVFDWIFAMDEENYRDVSGCFGGEGIGPVYMMTHFDPYAACSEIVDPYYGCERDFLGVYRQLDRAISYAYKEIIRGLPGRESSDPGGLSP